MSIPATSMTLGEAARHCGISKGTLSKAIAAGKLSATRREDSTWAIDGAELARYLSVNEHRFRQQPIPAVATDQLETLLTERARADLAEQRLADLRAALADMREQRDAWETQAQRLALTAPKQEGLGPKPWWSFRRRAG